MEVNTFCAQVLARCGDWMERVFIISQSPGLFSASFLFRPKLKALIVSLCLLPPPPTRIKKTVMTQAATAIAVEVLKLTADSSDAFGPLKSAAGGALHIVRLVQVCAHAVPVRTRLSSLIHEPGLQEQPGGLARFRT